MGLPKILVGGVLIIDLMSLSLTPSVDMETYTPISNSEVLSQLLRLKQYIETPTAQKPLWVRMSYDGETITVMGALYKEDGEPHFKLIVKILDRRLIIDVTFTQDEETLEWYIDTEDAKYLFTSSEQQTIADITDKDIQVNGITSKGIANTGGFGNIGDVAISGDLSVTGDTTAKTLEQSENNWESPVKTLNSQFLNGLTEVYSFIRIAKVNKKLYLIVSSLLKNETENDITTPSYVGMTGTGIVIPQNISSKIYRKDGTPCNQNAQGTITDDDSILGISFRVSNLNGSNSTSIDGCFYCAIQNDFGFYASNGITVPAGQSKIIDFRVSLLL